MWLLLIAAVATSIHAGHASAQTFSSTSPPKVISTAVPEYTEEARQARIEGTVILRFVVGTDGRTSDIKLVRVLGKGLDEKAVECLQKWRFQPGTRAGTQGNEPVSMKATAEIVFRLPPR